MDNNSEMNVDRWVSNHLAELNPDGKSQPDAARAFSLFKERNARANARAKKMICVAAAFGLACTIPLAFPKPRVFAQRCVAACQNLFADMPKVASVPRTAPDLASGSRSAGAPSPPTLAPTIPLKDLDDHDVTIAQYQGQVVLVNFWATWCDPCREEIPWLIEFQQKYGPRGLTILGVAMDEEGKTVVNPYLSNERFNVNGQKIAMSYRILLGSDAIAAKFGGVLGLPTSMFYSRDGKKIRTVVGLALTHDEYAKLIEGLL